MHKIWTSTEQVPPICVLSPDVNAGVLLLLVQHAVHGVVPCLTLPLQLAVLALCSDLLGLGLLQNVHQVCILHVQVFQLSSQLGCRLTLQ